MADEEKVLTREEVALLIGSHATRLADVARDYGLGRLHFRLRAVANQAEKDAAALRSDPESVR
jgi:hypothetical protein